MRLGPHEFPSGFLADELISHNSLQFKYIQVLHTILWEFVRHHYGLGSGGYLENYLNRFIRENEINLEDLCPYCAYICKKEEG